AACECLRTQRAEGKQEKTAIHRHSNQNLIHRSLLYGWPCSATPAEKKYAAAERQRRSGRVTMPQRSAARSERYRTRPDSEHPPRTSSRVPRFVRTPYVTSKARWVYLSTRPPPLNLLQY